MKFEVTLLGILTLAGMYYLEQVDKAAKATQYLLKTSVEMVQHHETRLASIEEAVLEVPDMKRELKEIRKILLARGYK